jgi:hypothetical protein
LSSKYQPATVVTPLGRFVHEECQSLIRLLRNL